MLNNSSDIFSHSNLLDDIPLIDLQPLVRDNNLAIVAKQIIDACKNHGFFYILNHGIDDDLVNKHTLNMKRFFNLPLDEKLKLDVRHSDAHRGYFPIYAENNDPKTSIDLKEGFDVMAEDNLYDERVVEKKPFYGPNQWPDNIDGFRENTTRYYEAMTVLSMMIMEAIAVGLNLPQKYFSNKLDGPFAMLRMLHYPHQSGPISSREMGTGSHTDYGLITILFQDDNEGLQIKSTNEGWINVQTIPGTFVVNIGDELQRWSNDVLKSNLHRVINISGNDRYSSPFFFHAAYDTVIDCLPSCENSNKLTNYTPITAGELMWQRIRATFSHHEDL
jgi:isopenicillin N synthase-like dioxygenase